MKGKGSPYLDPILQKQFQCYCNWLFFEYKFSLNFFKWFNYTPTAPLFTTSSKNSLEGLKIERASFAASADKPTKG